MNKQLSNILIRQKIQTTTTNMFSFSFLKLNFVLAHYIRRYLHYQPIPTFQYPTVLIGVIKLVQPVTVGFHLIPRIQIHRRLVPTTHVKIPNQH